MEYTVTRHVNRKHKPKRPRRFDDGSATTGRDEKRKRKARRIIQQDDA